jgi:non-ribosomal peptide synthetase component F
VRAVHPADPHPGPRVGHGGRRADGRRAGRPRRVLRQHPRSAAGRSGDPTFQELLARTRETDLAAFAHQDLPFERVVEAVNPVRSTDRHPLFQVMLTYQNNDDSAFDFPGLRTARVPLAPASVMFDLAVDLMETRDASRLPAGIRGSWDHATDLFDTSTVESLTSRFLDVLTAFAADAGSVDRVALFRSRR